MVTQIANFTTSYEEANAHFSAGRFEDAAKTFEHLFSLCGKENEIEDMLYFMYRAVFAWSQVNNTQEIINLYQKMGLISLKYSTKLAYVKLSTCTNMYQQMDLLDAINKNLTYLDDKEKQNSIMIERINVYKQMLEVVTLYSDKVHLVDKLIEMYTESDKQKEIVSYNLVKGKLIEKEAEYQLQSSDFDPELIAIRLLEKAKAVYQTIHRPNKVKKVDKKIRKLTQKVKIEE